MDTMDVGELLYQYTVKLTGLTEYGVSFEALMAGTTPPPPEGARFDLPFEGASIGPKLKGTVTGVDYLRVRADGRFELHKGQFSHTLSSQLSAANSASTFPGLDDLYDLETLVAQLIGMLIPQRPIPSILA